MSRVRSVRNEIASQAHGMGYCVQGRQFKALHKVVMRTGISN